MNNLLRPLGTLATAVFILIGISACSSSSVPPAVPNPNPHVAPQGSSGTNLKLGKWHTQTPMPTARGSISSGVVNGILYAVGGFNGAVLDTVEAYDPSTNAWTTEASMPTPREAPAAGVVNGVIYVIGGGSNIAPYYLNPVEAYDPSTNTWTTKAPMPTARCCLAAGVVNGILYAVGGFNAVALDTVEAYNPSTDTWTTKASMPTARGGLTAEVVNGILYAIGGATGGASPTFLNTVEAYDPSTDTWTTKASKPTAGPGLAAGVVNGIIYAVGGNSGSNVAPIFVNALEAYDPSTNTWTTKAPMPTAREGLAAGVVGRVLYAVGGYNGPFLNTLEAYTR